MNETNTTKAQKLMVLMLGATQTGYYLELFPENGQPVFDQNNDLVRQGLDPAVLQDVFNRTTNSGLDKQQIRDAFTVLNRLTVVAIDGYSGPDCPNHQVLLDLVAAAGRVAP